MFLQCLRTIAILAPLTVGVAVAAEDHGRLDVDGHALMAGSGNGVGDEDHVARRGLDGRVGEGTW